MSTLSHIGHINHASHISHASHINHISHINTPAFVAPTFVATIPHIFKPYGQHAKDRDGDGVGTDLALQKFWSQHDVQMMQHALRLAQQGASAGEVPVGAVLVTHDADKNALHIIGTGYNCPISTNDPTAHAEIVALKTACSHINNYRLPKNSTLYVTLEPCTMCIGALIHARLTRLVFATFEPRSGMVGSQLNLSNQSFYNHHIEVQHGLMRGASQRLLKQFFRQRRAKAKHPHPNADK